MKSTNLSWKTKHAVAAAILVYFSFAAASVGQFFGECWGIVTFFSNLHQSAFRAGSFVAYVYVGTLIIQAFAGPWNVAVALSTICSFVLGGVYLPSLLSKALGYKVLTLGVASSIVLFVLRLALAHRTSNLSNCYI